VASAFDDANATHYHLAVQREPTVVLVSPLPASSSTPDTAVVRCVTSRELLGASGQLVITHGGREYRLRVTQNGKLILTA
jgi:hemin uptake protein HemP